MKSLLIALVFLPLSAAAQTAEEIYEALRTPFKYGMVVAPQSNDEKFDCPTVFRVGDEWRMTYVRYNGRDGRDGRGYETWLAASPDLLHWRTLGRVLAYPDGEAWDKNQRGGFPALIDWTWDGSYAMQPWRGKHYMTYIGGPGRGYEAVEAPLSIGLATTASDIATAHPWQCGTTPLLTYNEPKAQWWEQMTQYKSTVYLDSDRRLGSRFVMFYNAGGRDATHPKGERIGIALSNDMRRWQRYAGNPVFAHDTDGTITGDAQIIRFPDRYAMVYFSAFNPTRPYKAYNTFAVSDDLVHWTDWTGPDLITPSKPYDEMFAHKSYVVRWQGVTYHFYCAVNRAGQRGIALATSQRCGQSDVHFPAPPATGHRYTERLDSGWNVNGKVMTVPFNLDDYYGYRQQVHGNLHGEAVCTKHFRTPRQGSRYFLRFEGVGTYADITLNGHHLGRYDIGRTCETIDITAAAAPAGSDNTLTVRVAHPDHITDMPWVCGGCSSEWGFSEGSQPFGIFRPVTLEATADTRIEPFGTHLYTMGDTLHIATELRNYGAAPAVVALTSKLQDADSRQVLRLTDSVALAPGECRTVQQHAVVSQPHRWQVDDPYLYHLVSLVKQAGKTIDELDTPYGFRTISWPKTNGTKQFLLNDSAVFINGVCEYEHLLGQSHAFTDEQVAARVRQVTGAGFNAFRDAHQPHNLRYNRAWDEQGVLWWPQFSAHIWYDTPQFRESFKRHLVQWVRERRNSPSLVLWGLQNESVLPRDFAQECCDIIRSLDPTCGPQRLITTCNGGEGTDWNVVQNWSGTYGGRLEDYARELKRPDQLLNGEYGAWRNAGNHTAGSPRSEEAFCDLLATKVRLAESARDSVCGQFLWLLNSHDNPGRRQPDEGYRKADKIGPVNYKGLFTPWDQPTEAYYMYKAHYVPATREPFVYLRHNGGYYTNCDSVSIDTAGCATAYLHGKAVARDGAGGVGRSPHLQPRPQPSASTAAATATSMPMATSGRPTAQPSPRRGKACRPVRRMPHASPCRASCRPCAMDDTNSLSISPHQRATTRHGSTSWSHGTGQGQATRPTTPPCDCSTWQ